MSEFYSFIPISDKVQIYKKESKIRNRLIPVIVPDTASKRQQRI